MNVTIEGTGIYSAPEAARLLDLPSQKARRWLAGYSFVYDGKRQIQPPLWPLQLPPTDHRLALGFLDLMQLRVVIRLKALGLSSQFVRRAIARAGEILEQPHPFVAKRFHTDGQGIFLEVAAELGETKLLDLHRGQWVMHKVIEPTFLDVDIEDDLMRRWWPLGKSRTIVLDPRRRFGRPIAAQSGVPVSTLYEAYGREKSVPQVAKWYDVREEEVIDALEIGPRILH